MMKQRFFTLIFMSMLACASTQAATTNVNVTVQYLEESTASTATYKDKAPEASPTLIFRMFCSRELGEKTFTKLGAFFKRATLMMPNQYLVVNIHENKIKVGLESYAQFLFLEPAQNAQPSRLELAPTHAVTCAQHQVAGCTQGCFETEVLAKSLAMFLATQLEVLQPSTFISQGTDFALRMVSVAIPLYYHYKNPQTPDQLPPAFTLDTAKRVGLYSLGYSAAAALGMLAQATYTVNAMKNRFKTLLPNVEPVGFDSQAVIAGFTAALPFVAVTGISCGVNHEAYKHVFAWILSMNTPK